MTRTLADYRPQHDEDCATKGNGCAGQCGEVYEGINCLGREGHTGEHYGYNRAKRWSTSNCSCGLSALLAGEEDTKPNCEHGDCPDHYGDEAAWCLKCREGFGRAPVPSGGKER